MNQSDKILSCFEKLEAIANNLAFTVHQYTTILSKFEDSYLNESCLQEKLTEQDKLNLGEQIVQLEVKIQSIYEDFLNCTTTLSKLLNDCEFIDFKIIDKLNWKHFNVVQYYDNTINEFKTFEKEFKEHDFSWIDFSKMERQKMKLNIAIKKVNECLLGNCEIQLLDVYEQEKEVFQSRACKDWEPSWEV